LRSIRIGAGSAWWGDRIEPARWNAERGDLDYLCFETMAEATISAAQVRRRRDPAFQGYDTYFDERMAAVLPGCLERGTRIVSNQGWLNPQGAAEQAVSLLRARGVRGKRVAAVTGSLITDRALDLTETIIESGASTASLADSLVSGEVYLGMDGILEALAAGADIVITGRVADPSLFAAPMVHEFGWDVLDHDRLGQALGLGHLLECGAQITGGYFADPGYKDIIEPWNLAFPIAEVCEDGSAVIGKIAGTGGVIDLRTVKEQLLYEIFDPANYLTPDVVVDFSTVRLEQTGPDRIRVSNISGKQRPETLKVSLGCVEGFMGEDIIFYAGPGAVRRARLAADIIERRLALVGLQADQVRIDFIGINAVHGPATPASAPDPYEVGVRVAARTRSRDEALRIGREIDAMAVSGVSMTGKRVPYQDRVREIIGLWSSLVPRRAVSHHIHWYEC
jgi:hypothetical protein